MKETIKRIGAIKVDWLAKPLIAILWWGAELVSLLVVALFAFWIWDVGVKEIEHKYDLYTRYCLYSAMGKIRGACPGLNLGKAEEIRLGEVGYEQESPWDRIWRVEISGSGIRATVMACRDFCVFAEFKGPYCLSPGIRSVHCLCPVSILIHTDTPDGRFGRSLRKVLPDYAVSGDSAVPAYPARFVPRVG